MAHARLTKAPAPTPLAERALAPDLARGMMLLFIALAHVPWFLYQAPVGPSTLHPVNGDPLDRVTQVATILMVDSRTWTMFGFLFAYGIGQLTARQHEKGMSDRDVRRTLRRRHLGLLAVGAVHALLLWQGDILGTYGLIGLLLAPLLLRRRDRTLLAWFAGLSIAALLIAVVSAGMEFLDPTAQVAPATLQRLAIAEPSYLVAALYRMPLWISGLVGGIETLAIPAAFLAGLLAARHRILEEPARHRDLLRVLAVVGIALGVGGGIPLALEQVGALGTPESGIFASLHFLTGIGQGIGYAALFGLVAHALTARRLQDAVAVRAVAALGRRSLSGYLAQSVLFMPILSAWGLGLGQHLSSWQVALVAVATWLLTVVGAVLLERGGQPGPAEIALRRLTYRGRRQARAAVLAPTG